ncbi:Cyclopentanol dehydrogenase [bioreactor metagenome]|jgi:NAD(P)-dependent dehydrogenase (short-subunit alcohol dehydrogenase family)|uniref:Cyclopentanol dehydrogenase n=1 Tax=bioreactor metagenome TaxID=1076179 RepID=A0A644VA86_9ZZZZ|nr:SDR family NAD(P)-dependent oxidoreductase [Bacteroidales bacterium]MBP6454947.1 SDR family NAD(P)-dependent oxidoreductase [Bacteroidales bacterium]MBP8677535.1 SDR family NAD(P)-dependent oxidoreductase [Bacteroidales bacterium]MBP9583860.1 SDR family NAD(P)-dependent oxidoreductase [Bacteroidales bacterium]MBP9979010.1 SDR family NAD(P)-dependent oxidoreductase [Bacteroidales bacterium]
MKNNWTTENIGSLEGKTIIITGGSSGIGLEAARVLSSKGANVIIAVRNLEKGESAAREIKEVYPKAIIEVMHIELSDLESVKKFAETFALKYSRLDILINNAGVMVPPLKLTKQGYELQFGTNHLAHFALTGLLLPLMKDIPGSRVVTVSSIAARGGKIHYDNLDAKKGYGAFKFYSQSKYANLLFGKRLDNILKGRSYQTKSIVCHPGVSATNLTSRGSGKPSPGILSWGFRLVGQPAHMGALPTLFAATEPNLKGGELIGPDGWDNWRGYPAVSNDMNRYYKESVAEKLFNISTEITGIAI